MNGPHIQQSVLADIEQQLASFEDQLFATIQSTTPSGLAVAVLQKAIRRGRGDMAQAAASLLLRTAPDRLWRRLTIVAVEDVGFGDVQSLYLTTVASAHRRRLAAIYGAEQLVSLVVARLAAAPKCRAADDLHVAAFDVPGWYGLRSELQTSSLDELLSIVAGDGGIEQRAIATSLAMAISSAAVFDLLCEIAPHTLVEIARTAYRQTREPFCAFIPLLHQYRGQCAGKLRSDEFPPETNVSGLPSWAFDKFSREGRAALSTFMRTDGATTSWLHTHVLPRDRTSVLAHALFRVESGLLKDRLIWPVGESLRRQADLKRWTFSSEDAATLLSLLSSEIGSLNKARDASYGW